MRGNHPGFLLAANCLELDKEILLSHLRGVSDWSKKAFLRRFAETLTVAGLFLILACLFTYPAVLNLATSVPGDAGDTLLFLWQLHHEIRSILNLDVSGFFNANIFHPYKLTLAYNDLILGDALLGLPVFLLTGSPVLTYNVVLLLTFVLSGTGMYRLALHLCHHRPAAFLAGMAFAFLPFHVAHMVHLNIQSTQWIPFTLLYLHRLYESGRLRFLIPFSIYLALQAVTCGYYGIFLFLFIGVFVLLVGPRLLRSSAGRVLLLKLASGGVAAAVVIFPFFKPYMDLKNDSGLKRGIEETNQFSAQPGMYFSVPAGNNLYGGRIGDNRTEAALFPGFLLLAISMYGAYRVMRVRTGKPGVPYFGFYAIMVGLSLLLSFGPIWTFGETTIKGPYYLLMRYGPGFDGLRVPARFSVMLCLGLCVFAAAGFRDLFLARLSLTGKILFPAAAALALAAEYASVPVRILHLPSRAELPRVYDWLSAQPGRAAVFEMPSSIETNLYTATRRMYASIYHGKALVDGYSGYYPPSHVFMGLPGAFVFPSERILGMLRDLDTQYLFVHSREYNPTAWAEMQSTLAQRTDNLRFLREVDGVHIYEFQRRVPTAQMTASDPLVSAAVLSNIPLNAKQAADSNLKTGWSTVRAQAPGDFLQLNFGSVRSFKRIALFQGPQLAEFPQSYLVETSMDGISWTRVAENPETVPPAASWKTTPRNTMFQIDLPHVVTSTFLRIRIGRVYTSLPWSVREVQLSL